MEPRLLMTETEVARVLRVHRSTLWSWRRRGIGPSWRRCGRLIRYPADELATWLCERRAQVPEERAA